MVSSIDTDVIVSHLDGELVGVIEAEALHGGH